MYKYILFIGYLATQCTAQSMHTDEQSFSTRQLPTFKTIKSKVLDNHLTPSREPQQCTVRYDWLTTRPQQNSLTAMQPAISLNNLLLISIFNKYLKDNPGEIPVVHLTSEFRSKLPLKWQQDFDTNGFIEIKNSCDAATLGYSLGHDTAAQLLNFCVSKSRIKSSSN